MPNIAAIATFASSLTANVERVIVGKRSAIELMAVALLCDGRAVAASIGGSFKRLQCTPDLLPNDVTGVSVFNQASGDFVFRPGPVFVNVLLARDHGPIDLERRKRDVSTRPAG
jgi:MoxR-like ATPase